MELDKFQSIFEVLSPVSRGPFQLLNGQQLQLWRKKCYFLADNASSLIDVGQTYLPVLLAPVFTSVALFMSDFAIFLE